MHLVFLAEDDTFIAATASALAAVDLEAVFARDWIEARLALEADDAGVFVCVASGACGQAWAALMKELHKERPLLVTVFLSPEVVASDAAHVAMLTSAPLAELIGTCRDADAVARLRRRT